MIEATAIHCCPRCGHPLITTDLARGICPACDLVLLPVDFALTVADWSRLRYTSEN